MMEKQSRIIAPTTGEIVFYQSSEGVPALEVKLENDTVWLSQRQMAALFDKDADTIGLHIRNVFKEGELDEGSTTEESSVVEKEGGRKITRRIRFYNLDVIISVGYRVKSKRGAQFRIWATGILRSHLLKGYTINEKRLKELNQAIRLIAEVADRKALTGDEATALLRVVADYSYALDLLDDYDHERVRRGDTTHGPVSTIAYEEAVRLIERLRSQFDAGDVFGLEKMIVSKGLWPILCRPSTEKNFTPASKKRRRAYSTFSSKIIPS